MTDNLLKDLKEMFPESVENGQIVFDKLCVAMAQTISDLQDQMNEKDYQILRITERLDKLER